MVVILGLWQTYTLRQTRGRSYFITLFLMQFKLGKEVQF